MRGEAEAARPPVWLWPNLLSLDAPLVAMLWQWFFAKASGVTLPATSHLLLGAVVWVIYVIDRLGDAVRLDESGPATERHLFYRRHWKIFLAGVIVAAIFSTGAVFYRLPEALAARGFFVGLLVAAYFLYLARARRLKRIAIPKEILCGILFAAGTSLCTEFYKSTAGMSGTGFVQRFVLEGTAATLAAWNPVVLVFMALCSMNCALIAVWERSADEAQDPAALTQASPASFDVSFSISFLLLTGVSLGLAIAGRGNPETAVYCSMAASALLLWILERRAASFSTPALRTLADVALLTPLVAGMLTGW